LESPAADTLEAQKEVDQLRQIAAQLRGSANDYWAAQVGIRASRVTSTTPRKANPIHHQE
jgi:hypothetical protein